MISLTPTQKKLFDFIKAEIDSTGIAPSYDEMAKHMGMRSKGGVHALVQDIEARGWITVHKFRARAMEILEAKCPHCGKSL